MNLKRISVFTENQGGRPLFFDKYLKKPEYLHAEVFA